MTSGFSRLTEVHLYLHQDDSIVQVFGFFIGTLSFSSSMYMFNTLKGSASMAIQRASGAANRESDSNPFSFKNFVSKEKDVASKKNRVLQIIGDEVHEVKPMSAHSLQDNGSNSQYVFGFTPPGSDTSDSETEERHSNALNCHSPDSGSVHYVVASANSSHEQLLLIEELNQLREDNKKLKKEVEDVTLSRDNERKKVFTLQKKLAMIEKREAEETAALENMVQMVEKNLELTTKRALKAEAQVIKMKEEIKGAKTETVPMETYQELLDTHHSTLTSIKAKSRAASDEMILAARRAEQALRDLYSGVDTLKIVSSELHYIDRITDITPPDHAS
ncbi:endosome-associated-trafficking regulator 1 isoform X2 [Exaiptasia diaphana]|uniref:Endosome-associated-trafficking regulator 1 n=1 Tax=Exaiptasia diaphana TaxID=2652724 RepID=A0A913X7A1_EXADI|nr:endosome-associated-trafficking regulator 1 isoform X2 [Exaiptasia diaphana]